jgi:hypothetical protein
LKQFEFDLPNGEACRIEGITYEDALWTFMQYKALGYPSGEILYSVSLMPIVAFKTVERGWSYRR